MHENSPVTVNAVFSLALLGLYAYCLFDFSRTDERDMRTFTRPTWIGILVFGNVVGGLLWLLYGRPKHPAAL